MVVPTYDFIIGQGDQNPTAQFLVFTKDSSGNRSAIPYSRFSGATVSFRLFRTLGQSPVISGPGTIAQASDGISAQFNYVWQPGDTATAGVYRGYFVVTYANGTTERFPKPDSIVVYIQPS